MSVRSLLSLQIVLLVQPFAHLPRSYHSYRNITAILGTLCVTVLFAIQTVHRAVVIAQVPPELDLDDEDEVADFNGFRKR